MKIKYYKNLHTKEVVYEDEAYRYILDFYGLKQEEKKTDEIIKEFKETIIEWFFSDNWIEEWEDVG